MIFLPHAYRGDWFLAVYRYNSFMRSWGSSNRVRSNIVVLNISERIFQYPWATAHCTVLRKSSHEEVMDS